MKCEKCHVNEATVFLTQTRNGETVEMHLCDACAKENEAVLFDDGISFQQFLSGLLESNKSPEIKSSKLTCSQCGMTIDEFKRHSLVGCAGCYSSFNTYLQAIIKRLQGNVIHTGKKPMNADVSHKIQEQIHRLESELKIALMQENYEQAAQLRDRIRELKGDDAL